MGGHADADAGRAAVARLVEPFLGMFLPAERGRRGGALGTGVLDDLVEVFFCWGDHQSSLEEIVAADQQHA